MPVRRDAAAGSARLSAARLSPCAGPPQDAGVDVHLFHGVAAPAAGTGASATVSTARTRCECLSRSSQACGRQPGCIGGVVRIRSCGSSITTTPVARARSCSRMTCRRRRRLVSGQERRVYVCGRYEIDPVAHPVCAVVGAKIALEQVTVTG